MEITILVLTVLGGWIFWRHIRKSRSDVEQAHSDRVQREISSLHRLGGRSFPAERPSRSGGAQRATASKRHQKPTKPTIHLTLEAGTTYDLTYEAADGNVSRRKVRFTGMTHEDGTQYLSAYCFKAKAPRTFRVDRIVSLTDSETGEILL